MTTPDSFNRRLSRWLAEDSAHRVPDHLEEVLLRTVGTRQRPAWSSLEAWLPLDRFSASRNRVATWAFVPALLVVTLLCAMLALAIVGAAKPPRPLGLGLAENGTIAWADGPGIRVASADGTGARELVRDVGVVFGLRWSPDGTRLAFRSNASGGSVMVADADGSNRRTVSGPIKAGGDDEVAWSPDGSRLVFAAGANLTGKLIVVNADGSGVSELPLSAIRGLNGPRHAAWSPDGASISFIARKLVPNEDLRLYLIAPDGSSLHSVATSGFTANGDLGGVVWAPTLDHQWLAYVGRGVMVLDVATGKEFEIAKGFWPSWSPDGTLLAGRMAGNMKVVNVGELLASPTTATAWDLQPTGSGSYCLDSPELARRAICSVPVWSPDGRFVAGADVAGGAMTILSVDGSTAPISIPFVATAAHMIALPGPVEVPTLSAAWQPVAR